jgi:hypothetical protein
MNNPTTEALLALDKYFKANPDNDAMLHRARLRAILKAYGERWSNDVGNYEVLAVEKLMTAPIKSLDNGKDSGFIAGGKIDVIVKERVGNNNLIVLDHKFLSTAFTPEKAQHLTIDGQPSQYAYLCWCEGIKITHVIWDYIVKSLHRKNRNETWEAFEDRVFKIYMEDPDRFGRYKVPVVKDNVAEYLNELYHWAKEIGLEAKGDIHLKSRGHCWEYNQACTYINLCTGYGDENDGTWVKSGTEHSELPLDKSVDPFKIITNSRVKSYQTCRQKHHYLYNMGLKKIKKDYSEPLEVGTAGHEALQKYWETIGGL